MEWNNNNANANRRALVSDYPPANMSVYIATDGVIYRNDVHDIATGKKPRGDFTYLSTRVSPKQDENEREEAKHLYEASSLTPDEMDNIEDDDSEGDFKPVLILVALRLGIDSLHPTYHPALKTCFEIPSFVGIAGGRPNSSLYFIGLQGDELIYLDPHFSRPALETKSLADYTKRDFSSYHCTIPRKINIANIDPSMLLGFYCRTLSEFNSLCDQLKMVYFKIRISKP
jgi:cysteine protease ATG4